VRARNRMILAKTAICFGGVLCRQQIIGYGDHGEEDEDEHGYGDKLPGATDPNPRSKVGPRAKYHGCEQCPGEIETQLHP